VIGIYKKIFIITLLINVTFFIYYLANSDINPSIDAFYYLSIADSVRNGTGFVNITTDPPEPIYTPQNGIVFVHILLQSIGFNNAESRLCAIKIINYLGFCLLIYIFYNVFRQFKISQELTFLSLGILLSSAHFLKTIIQPLNEGIWCVLTAIVFYLAILNDNKENYLNIALIILSGIVLANFRLNGPIIILSIAFTYLFLRKFEKSLMFFGIFLLSYVSIYIILAMFNVDKSGFSSFSSVYTFNYILSRPLVTLIYTMPGAFMGITGKWWPLFDQPPREYLRLIGGWIIVLPFSLLLCYYYILYLVKEIKEQNFPKLLTIFYIILLVLCLQIMPGGDSRYIITIVPFSLLAITTMFNDSKKLRLFMGFLLLSTILISTFRLVGWDSIFFINNKSSVNIKKQMVEPYTLISEASRYSYFIFGKGSNSLKDLNNEAKNIVVFGRNIFNEETLKKLQEKYKIDHIQYLPDRIIVAHGSDEIYHTVKIVAE
jgi:hypothetical protein